MGGGTGRVDPMALPRGAQAMGLHLRHDLPELYRSCIIIDRTII